MDKFNLKKFITEGKLLKENKSLKENEDWDFEESILKIVNELKEYNSVLSPGNYIKEKLGKAIEELEGVLDEDENELSSVSLDESKSLKEEMDGGKSTQSLLSFIKANQEEVAEKTMNIEYFPFEDIEVDGLGDVSIVLKNEDGGMSFKYPEDVDSEFVGENNEQPQPITINGVDLMYVEYNI